MSSTENPNPTNLTGEWAQKLVADMDRIGAMSLENARRNVQFLSRGR
ncbi:hypothetical protein [Nitrospina watsonii]|uniref:Uncharacterized protein n=1 Tax=Nitrospina watsonii TaxID=1323948 RepID=A0ABM9HA33_9BACT|nr:hypothetical protein [Nitrospina watsonii]CAI2717008.1 protein of unknown function [Nitrospina watsonii]